jgi:hypothetical protein
MPNTYRLGDDDLLHFQAGDRDRPPRSGDRVEDREGRALGWLAFPWPQRECQPSWSAQSMVIVYAV